MEKIYKSILKLKDFCIFSQSKISASCNISLAELKGIDVMENHDCITCSELSEKMNLSPSRGSRIIDTLFKKGYLSRKTKNHDRRSTLLCLTKKGGEIKREIEKEQKVFEQLLSTEMSVEEIKSIKIGLKTLEKFLVKTKKGDKDVRKNINRTQ